MNVYDIPTKHMAPKNKSRIFIAQPSKPMKNSGTLSNRKHIWFQFLYQLSNKPPRLTIYCTTDSHIENEENFQVISKLIGLK